MVEAAGGQPHQISFLANSNVNAVQWSPDGKFILYETSQRTENPAIERIDLTPRQPNYAEERFEDLFKPEPSGRGGRRLEPMRKRNRCRKSKSISTTFVRAFR